MLSPQINHHGSGTAGKCSKRQCRQLEGLAKMLQVASISYIRTEEPFFNEFD